ncbi:uncharacterized protein LOC106647776 [Copidosoma floridanum]|uniref:uncharacterized protein LOC106647776 n=1 Tax=Copidosoma floridanum TaxID=29053 RepID=UPI0006C97AC4|nr:uncharacterized protein LOC106647776 [Copidosoma floridanum]
MLQAVRLLTEMARSDDRSRGESPASEAQASTSTGEATPPVIFREIHKNGWLRRTDCKPEKEQSSRCWVAFCVYDDAEPRLEGFADQRQATTHSPIWSQSLRPTQHLSPTLCATPKNDFEFCVSLADNKALRLAAPTYQAMMDWVQVVTRKLTEMKVLGPKENLYSKPPERIATRDPTSPLPPPPASLSTGTRTAAAMAGVPVGISASPSTSNAPTVFTFDDIALEERRPSIRRPNRPAPPIPLSPRLGGTTANAGESSYESVFLASSSYPQNSESSRSNNNTSASRSHSSNDENDQYAALIEYRSLDNADTTTTTSMNSNSAAGNVQVSASSQSRQARNQLGHQLTLRETQVLQLRKEMSHPAGVRLKLGRRDCKDGIAFVDCFGAVWIAGWKHKDHPLLYNVLHIGDLVLSVAGVPLNGASSVKDIIKNNTSPRVEMIVRRLPHGRVTTLTRRNESEDFGIEIGSSNEILSVSATAQSLGLSVIANPADPSAEIGTTVGYTITEVNNRPLFESSARERVNASLGRDVSIVFQPSDLVHAIRDKLRTVRSYKSFV